jgi:hypothetical protein
MKQMKFIKQLVTPQIAKMYLNNNDGNRRVSSPRLLMYCDDILNGRWKEDTGECIKISVTKKVIDGQHRLLAIVKTGVPLNLHIALDVNDDVFDVIDTGKSRNATDVFKIANIKHESSIPSIIATYNILVENRKFGSQIHKSKTNAMLLEQYYENGLFWQNVAKKAHSWYLAYAKILTPSFIGSFFAYFYELNQNKAESFINQLTTGIGIENEVVNMLRNKLMQDKMSQRKMPLNLKMALVIKAWNVFVKNKSIKQLKFDVLREEFPTASKN